MHYRFITESQSKSPSSSVLHTTFSSCFFGSSKVAGWVALWGLTEPLEKHTRDFPVLEEFVRMGVEHIDAHWPHRYRRQIKMPACYPAQKRNIGAQRDWSTHI